MKRLKTLLKVLLILAASLALLAWLVFQLPPFGGSFSGARLERMQHSPQFIEGRFEDTPKEKTDHSIIKNLQLYRQGINREPPFPIPVTPIDPETFKTPPVSGLRVQWFGHATVLVEIDKLRIMTDPVLSERASPFSFIGPKRFHPPPVSLEQLSGIDAVVISHDHYDHLDMATIQHLAAQGTQFFVGLGIGAHLERWQVPAAQIHEMDWWETADIKGVTIHCTPARHYSGRKTMDNSTLWASWLLKGPEHSVYFSGDTGYAGHFKLVQERIGAPDLTLIKIGAYGETWLDIHMDPESAIQAHQDLGAAAMLPIHWGTFDLSYHAWAEPVLRARAAADKAGVELITPRVGQTYTFGDSSASTRWYEGK